MKNQNLKGYLTLFMVGLLTAFQWGCSNSNSPTGNTNSGIPLSALFPYSSTASSSAGGAGSSANSSMTNNYNNAFSSVFSSMASFSAPSTATWAIGMIIGEDADTTDLGGSNYALGYGMVALSVNNSAVSTAGVTLTPNGGAAIPLPYLASTSYNGYNYSWYWSGSVDAPSTITYLPGTTYTMSIGNVGGTTSSSLVVPGGYSFGYNMSTTGQVAATIASPGSLDAAFVFGISGYTGSLTYQNTSASGSPFVFPTSAYTAMGAGTTFISVHEDVNYTTTVSSTMGMKGGMIGVGLGMAESNK